LKLKRIFEANFISVCFIKTLGRQRLKLTFFNFNPDLKVGAKVTDKVHLLVTDSVHPTPNFPKVV